VRFGRPAGPPDDGRHPDRHGQGRSQGPAGHASGGRPHPGPGRGVLRRLWDAARGLRTGRRRAPAAPVPHGPGHPRILRRPYGRAPDCRSAADRRARHRGSARRRGGPALAAGAACPSGDLGLQHAESGRPQPAARHPGASADLQDGLHHADRPGRPRAGPARRAVRREQLPGQTLHHRPAEREAGSGAGRAARARGAGRSLCVVRSRRRADDGSGQLRGPVPARPGGGGRGDEPLPAARRRRGRERGQPPLRRLSDGSPDQRRAEGGRSARAAGGQAVRRRPDVRRPDGHRVGQRRLRREVSGGRGHSRRQPQSEGRRRASYSLLAGQRSGAQSRPAGRHGGGVVGHPRRDRGGGRAGVRGAAPTARRDAAGLSDAQPELRRPDPAGRGAGRSGPGRGRGSADGHRPGRP
uniref:DNA-directed DNA polymerase n=1 Tax=Parastrongyloides trichosuri TaxID=131310 RepID=A0A0N5A4E0_PARTI